jgi:general secretion pathway protein J
MTWAACSIPLRRNRSREAGFTLVEMLVSLMLLTLIMSFIPGTLRIGQRVWETDDRFERRAGLAAFRRYVEQRLAEAIPIQQREESGLRMEFTGEPDHLAFVAPAAAGPAGGGVYRFDLRRDGGPGAVQPLVLSQSVYRAAPRPSADASTMSMAHRSTFRVADLSFRYFGVAQADEAPRWLPQWPRRDSLPDLVEISVVVGQPARVQRAVVALRLKTR